MKRKLIYRIFAITLLLTMILPALPVGAAESTSSWSFDRETGKLSIYESDAMALSFSSGSTDKWRAYASEIKSVTIGDGVILIASYAFENCENLTQVEISNSVCSIDSFAFKGCKSLTRVEIPNSVRFIDMCAFDACYNLTSVDFEAGSRLEYILTAAFMRCTNLTSIEIPDSVIYLDMDAFNSCTNLESVKFGTNSKLTDIGTRAFQNCKKLGNIEIPAGVTSLGARTFEGCTSLAAITYRGTRQKWDKIEKGSNWCSANVKINCHEHAYGAWKITKAPTDTAEGMKERSCACGYKEYEVIPLPETEPAPTDTTAPERDTEAVPTDTTNETVSNNYLEQAYDVFRQIYDPFHLLPSGCGSSIASPALFCVISIGAACLLRRKKD